MGRRGSSSSGFRMGMGLRGKPALILLCLLILIIFIVIYFRRPAPAPYEHEHNQYDKRKSFNMGRNNFDPQRFVVNNDAQKDPVHSNDSPVRYKEDKIQKSNNIEFKNEDSKLLDKDDNRNDHEDIGLNKNLMLNNPIRNRANMVTPSFNNDLLNDNRQQQVNQRFGNEIGQGIEKQITGIQNGREGGKSEDEKEELNEIEMLYTSQYSNTVDFKNMKHIVHLDFKGAVPKLQYLSNILPLMKSLGATGLLVEYEDMFPYEGTLSPIPALNAFTKDTLSKFLTLARDLQLEIIPLVQTFGHMEFVLKLQEFAHLREADETPQVIAPLVKDSYSLIHSLIDQIINMHPNSRYIHLGCDEVYQLGTGRSSIYIKEKNYTKSQIFFEHVSSIVTYIKEKYPQVKPIIWDDEFRQEPLEVVKKFGIGDVLEPMIWSYLPNPRDRFTDDIWEKYGLTFKNVWAASSFKGATGVNQFYTNITHHLSNHLGWVDVITEAKKVAPKMNFRGVAMTGWQRYDHFATLCELLPPAIPSMALSLSAIVHGGFTETDHSAVKDKLRCIDEELLNCTYPGNQLFKAIYRLKQIEDKYTRDAGLKSRLDGWLTDYNIKHGFGSPGQLRVLERKLNATIFNYTTIRKDLETSILKYYDTYTADEWLSVHIDQKLKYFSEKMSQAQKLIKIRIHSRRPLLSKYQQLQNNNPGTNINNNNVLSNKHQLSYNQQHRARANNPITLHSQKVNLFNPPLEKEARKSFQFRPVNDNISLNNKFDQQKFAHQKQRYMNKIPDAAVNRNSN